MPSPLSKETQQRVLDEFALHQNQAETSRNTGVGLSSVRRIIKHAGLKPSGSRKWGVLTEEQKDQLVALYRKEVPNKEIMAQIGLPGRGTDLIYSTLRARKEPRRMPHTARTGRKLHPGATATTSDGYVLEKVPPSWPYIKDMFGYGDGSWIAQHRKVMAEHLGRALLQGEQVHHKDGDRTNNRLHNLQLRQGSHGSGASFRCKSCGSQDVEAVDL